MIDSTRSFREFGNELAACDPFVETLRRYALNITDIRCRVLADLALVQAYYIGLTSSLCVLGDTMAIFAGARSSATDSLNGGPSLGRTVFVQQESRGAGLGATRLEFVEQEEGLWVARRFLGSWHGPEWFTEIARRLLGDPPEGQFETPVSDIEAAFESLIGAMAAKEKEQR
jgi:hypothetical protein